MDHALLACGPYFNEAGLVASLVLLVLVKPLSYYAYIIAFRYRVSAEIPMTVGQGVKLALLRAGLGLALVGGGAFLMANMFGSAGVIAGWVYLYPSRIFAWWIVGRLAKLQGWRMVGWIVGGEAINIAFDLAILGGLAEGIVFPMIAAVVVAIFIYVLHWRGHRPELLARFAANPHCPVCQYNLTGNLSGVCPECGTPIRLVAATV